MNRELSQMEAISPRASSPHSPRPGSGSKRSAHSSPAVTPAAASEFADGSDYEIVEAVDRAKV